MPDILIRGMEMPQSCKCCPCYEQSLAFPDYIKRCKFGADLPQPWPLQYEKRGDNCPLIELPQQTVETNLYDQEEIHHNCTVQILKNSVTGEVSVGWWPNDNKPIETKEGK